MENETKIVYNISKFWSYKTLIHAKHLCIRFGKINRFIRVYRGTRYLVLFGGEKYGLIYNRIRYLIGVKSGITYVISHNYAKIKIDLLGSLPLEKPLMLKNKLFIMLLYSLSQFLIRFKITTTIIYF